MSDKIRLGFAMTGSFCTFAQVIPQLKVLASLYDVTPIFSPISYTSNNRFGDAKNWIAQVQDICGKTVLHTLEQVEPIGPQKSLDILTVAPCTGNSLGKLACGIYDTPVVMACKSHLRNGRPLVLAVSTNDALGISAANLGRLMAFRHIFFVPFRQDDFQKKPTSLVADFSLLPQTVSSALSNHQLQPMLLPPLSSPASP